MNDFNWLNIAFVVPGNNPETDEDDCQIMTTAKMILPRKGEGIWLLQEPEKAQAIEKFGTSTFIVTDIYHHIASGKGGCYDNIVVYVEPLKA